MRIPLAMMNRHGLIAGATGTGKTKTLQLMAEQLSAAGVPVFAADVKGDLSGLAAAGTPNDKVDHRAKDIGYAWEPRAIPTEFVSLTGKLGVQLRATVSSFGPLLLSQSALPERDAVRRAGDGVPLRRRQGPPAARFRGSARGAPVSFVGRRASRSSRRTAGCPAQPSAYCSGR